MTRVYCLFLLLLCSKHALTQDVKLSDLKTPNSPGFQLLDISPSSIERPTNPKEFSAKVLNLLNGTTLPKNFAFEFSPFWFFKPTHENIYRYFNINEDSTEQTVNATSFSGITRKFNVSLASSFNDATAGSLLQNTNYISIGARTNLFTVRSQKQNIRLAKNILDAARLMNNLSALRPDGTRPSLTEIEGALDNNDEFQGYVNSLQELPLVQLDIAYAYSDAFANNDFSGRRFNRAGIWLSLAVNHSFGKEGGKKHDLSFIGLAKGIKDNVLTDTAAMMFNKEKAFDYGGKVEYTVNRLTTSFEYIKRAYSDASSLDSHRAVGLIRYKVNDNLYLTGTYGKNFGNFKNVFTLLGLNWGFGAAPLKLE